MIVSILKKDNRQFMRECGKSDKIAKSDGKHDLKIRQVIDII